MIIDAIVLGAGSGSRFKSVGSSPCSLPKQFEIICEKPVIVWAIESIFQDCAVRNMIVVAPEPLLEQTKQILQNYLPIRLESISVIPGGARRQDSSLKGLEALELCSPLAEQVLIHDACRPYLGKTLQTGLQFYKSRPDCFGWVPGLEVTETLKRVESEIIKNTVDRSGLFRMQTPQIFNFSILLKAAKKLAPKHLIFTDDASLLEQERLPVGVFAGDYRNIKLTYDYELELLTRYLQKERPVSCESEMATTSTELFPL